MSALSATQIAASASRAGFPASEIATAVAVAYAESNGDPTATNHNSNGSTDYGLWQINSIHGALLQQGTWSNPDDNARMAYTLWKESGWKPWVTFNTGAYKKFLGQAADVSTQPTTATNADFSLPNPLSGIDAISNAFTKISDAALWKRIGLGALGLFVIIVALVFIFRKQIGSVADNIPAVIPV